MPGEGAVVKWIRAQSPQAAAFDLAQRRWHQIANFPGFGGQQGGWSTQDPQRAVIIALWTSRAAHDAFLDTTHSDIAEAQRTSYTSIDVGLLDVEITTEQPPQLHQADRVLRTATCCLRPGHLSHVLDVQQQIWLPAMKDAGMGSGLLASGYDDTNLEPFIVVMTTWPSRRVHDDYQHHRVPQLRKQADVGSDFTSIAGDLIALEPGWTVPPT